jgi:isopenicillin-N epimerase
LGAFTNSLKGNSVTETTVGSLRSDFLLDPSVTFLNHGSFGACPKPVFEEYQRWQREMESQPVEFVQRRLPGLMADARADLGEYLNVSSDDLVYVPNATHGVNIVARSWPLEAGDEVLTTDHEYGALDLTWEFYCGKSGATYRKVPIPVPVTTPEAFVEYFWSAVTSRTKIIYLSHITSPTALVFPIEEICRKARSAGILTVIDGAHAISQLPIDLAAIDADVYTGNNHKWLCAPKGSGFLYVRPDHHDWVESAIISWGWAEPSTFVSRNEYQGTRDMAPFLATPAAIRYQREHDWASQRARCHALALKARDQIADLWDVPPLTPEDPDGWFSQLVSCPLPNIDVAVAKARLYDEFKVEVPFIDWHGLKGVRVSFQAYNDENDLDRLIEGLKVVVGR